MKPGDKLGPYEILASIGKGGMGEVYRARDTRLGRDVAIKVSDEQFTERFTREARAIAALNHTNICHLYDVGPNYLVMELVEGDTLRGPLELKDAMPIIKQLIEGIEAAHEKNIVHRDLKPANIKITPEGVVKILDFGLAKATEPEQQGDSENSPTLTMGATKVGTILGTAAYMSPEQARGKQVDKRSDIWSFGVVVYELLAGKRPFEGETVVETLGAVINKAPDWGRVPSEARRLLEWCLEKERKQRLASISDARRVLDDATAQTAPSRSRLGWMSRFGWVAWAVAALTTLAALALGFLYFRQPAGQPERAVRFDLRLPEKPTLGALKLSPDGHYLAISDIGARKLQVRALDSLEFRTLPGTDNAMFPFWSPDSAYIGFFADGKLKKISVNGGPAQTLCDASLGWGGSWNRDGVIVFSVGFPGGIQRVASAGGAPVAVTKQGSYPEFLPDGRRFLYSGDDGIYAGSLDGAPPQRILSDLSSAAYAPSIPSRGSGYLLFRREETLMAAPFDPQRLRITGEVFPVAERVGYASGGNAAFSVSANGVLAHHAGVETGRELVWMDRSGKRLSAIGKPGRISFEALSPDEKTLAYQVDDLSGHSDIWLYDLARDTASRFTFGPGQATTPIWSPDGSRVAYGRSIDRNGYDIYQKPASGGKEALLLRVGRLLRLYDWSRDGKTLVYVPDIGSATKADLWLLPMGADHKPAVYLATQFGEYDAQFSYDGRWMAYTSDESGKEQVNVQPVPPTGAKWQVSTAGGNRARWRRDGKELFYIASDQKLMAVPVKTGSGFEADAPRELFPTPITTAQTYQFFYKPSADGQRFLMNIPAGEAASQPTITVELNWQAGLKR